MLLSHKFFPATLLTLALAAIPSSRSIALAQTAAAGTPLATKPLIEPRVLANSDGKQRRDPESGIVEAYLPALYPSSHAANLLQLKNGDVLCVWFSGTWEGDSNVGIVISRLPKGASQWTPTKLIDRHEGESYQNPVLFEAPDSTVHLFHTTQQAQAGEANAHVLHLTSKDHGQTWSAPQLLFDKPGSFTRHSLLILADGTWMLPLTYVTSEDIGKGADTNYSATMLSRDNGTTWTECLIPKSQGKVQPTIAALARDRLVAFFRSRASDFIYRSESRDGCHWSAPVKTVLPNNNASVQLFGLQDGNLVMAFNNSAIVRPDPDRSGAHPTAGLRKPLSLALSEDGGQSWRFVHDLETGRPGYGMAERDAKTPGREEYSYPSVMQRADGKIMVAYTYRRQTIKVVVLTEDWIKNNSTRSQGLYTGQPPP
jgi:predicted neuraminidase